MREKYVISLLSQVFINLFTIIANYILIFYLDVELLGIWALLNSIVSLGFLFIQLGLDTIHLQYSGKKNFNDYFSSFFILKILLLSMNISFSLILITIFNLWEHPYLNVLLFLTFSFIIQDIINIFISQLKANLKIFKVEISNFAFLSCQNIIKIYIGININSFSNPLYYLSIIFFLIYILYLVIIVLFSIKEIRFSIPKKSYINNYIKEVKPLVIFNVLAMIASNIGNIILAYSFNNKTLAYFYLVLMYIIPSLNIIFESLKSVSLPLYSKYIANGNKKSIESILYLTEKYISIIMLSIILIFLSIGELIFSILLPNYINSLPILYILIFIPYLQGISSQYGAVLIAGGKQKSLARIHIIRLALEIFLILLFIPKILFKFNLFGWGSIGYALAIFLPRFIVVFGLRYSVARSFNISSQKQIISHLPLALISFITVFLIRIYLLDYLITNKIIMIITLSFLVIGLFLVELIVFRVLKKKDIAFILNLLKIRMYINSMKNEFVDL